MGFFYLRSCDQTGLLSSEYWGFLPQGVKLTRREVDHPRPSSAKVKNAWSYTTIHSIHLDDVLLN